MTGIFRSYSIGQQRAHLQALNDPQIGQLYAKSSLSSAESTKKTLRLMAVSEAGSMKAGPLRDVLVTACIVSGVALIVIAGLGTSGDLSGSTLYATAGSLAAVSIVTMTAVLAKDLKQTALEATVTALAALSFATFITLGSLGVIDPQTAGTAILVTIAARTALAFIASRFKERYLESRGVNVDELVENLEPPYPYFAELGASSIESMVRVLRESLT